ncbi:glycosyltransferase family 39 protein [Geitlerinema splendidum]|nr:glycosyltransferase family 39 protein [Geitlerinema splendidum]
MLVLLCVLPYLGFWLYGLTDLDEGFYGAVVTDMLRRGDWLTPTLNGSPWFEKPILSYWLAMPTVALFGNEFGARLPSFLCTMATCFVLFRFAKKNFNEASSQLAPLIFATGLLVVAVGRMMMTDSALVLCMTLAFTSFYDSLTGDRRLRLWTAAFLGLAVLAKGPVGAVLFVVVAIIFYAATPELRQAYKGWWLVGTLILIGVVSTWYLPAYLANGQFFIDKFLIEQNIGRFSGGDKAHGVPFWAHPIYFPLVILLSTIPWLFLSMRRGLIKAKAWQTPDEAGYARRYLWIWFLTILGFFTISGTKLVHYILPALPALALLMADALSTANRRQLLTAIYATPLVMLFLANYAFITYWQKQFAPVQSLAKYTFAEKQKLIVYAMGGNGNPEIKLSLDESSHPSIGFYYKAPFGEKNSLNELRELSDTHWIIARDSSHEELIEVPGIALIRSRQNYNLYEFTPAFER